ncbi:MAG: hypothetical protein WCY65_00635 [Candidatus Methanomethylophilaceae archaeon]
MGRAAGLTIGVITLSALGALATSSGVMAAEFSGFILPDVSIQSIIDYFTALAQDPNIYASFDYQAFLEFSREGYFGRYFLLAVIGIYFLSMFFMLFGLRRARKAVR